MNPQIVQVAPQRDYSVYVYFADGKVVAYDVSHLLEKKVFSPLKDIELFMKTCTIMNGTLAWDISGTRDEERCLDIAPDMLYSLEAVKERVV